MELRVTSPDPFGVLTSTKWVLDRSLFISFNEAVLGTVAEKVRERVHRGFDTVEAGFGTAGTFADDVQLIFLEDVVNFCFWPDPGSPRWLVEWPLGNKPRHGWYALKSCFQRAIHEKIPILDASYLSSFSKEDAAYVFRGMDGIFIPLLERRVEFLREASWILLDRYGGTFVTALEDVGYDVVELVREIVAHFFSFHDTAVLEGVPVYFFKRAQICAHDLSYLSQKYSKVSLHNLEQLTAFADYRLPQILRMLGVVSYSPELAEKVDRKVLISAGSREEVEIRSAAIWGVELIRQRLLEFTASQVDNALWLLSQELPDSYPYHLTRTTAY